MNLFDSLSKAQLRSNSKKRGDVILLLCVLALSVFGVFAVFSASRYTAEKDYGNAFYFCNKQLIGLAIGAIFMFVCASFDYRKIKKAAVWIYLFSVLLLALVFVPMISVKIYGAARWINLGIFTLQPSEVAKFAFVLFAASYFSTDMTRSKRFIGLLPVIGAGLLICLLIIIEPNMSITVCVGLVMLSMLFFAGIKLKHFCLILVPLALAVPILIILEPYRLNRLSAFINPWSSPKGEGYQLLQSLYALGSGGLFGVGFLNSRQKYSFLPFSESDFILSVIGEEFGFFGLAILFLVMFTVIYRGIKIAARAKNFFSYLIAVGITSVYSVQVMLNALVVSGSIPPTGLPLPLISAGNTSIIVFLGAFGLLYNISKNSDKATI